MPLHVAHFAPRYPPALGGAEAYVARLSEYHSTQGDTVTVWTSTAVELREMWFQSVPRTSSSQERAGLRVQRYRPQVFPLRRYILKALSLLPIRQLQALAQPVNPICLGMWRDVRCDFTPLDAVHAFAFPYAFPIVCAFRLARRRRVPFLLTPFLHLGDPTDPHDRTRRQYTRPHLRWLLQQAEAVFLQTESELQAAIELGVKPECAVLQGLGVDESECTGGDRFRVRCQWGVSESEVIVGHLANNSIEKGTVDLLQAAMQVNAKVVLAGPEMPNFLAFWKSYPRKDLVTRLGPLSESQKRDFFAGLDIFALPSRTDSFGLVLLEAWANGKPVVAYRAGGPADLVQHERDGLLARCGGVEELAGQLRGLIQNAEIRERFGEVGRSRIGSEFQWDRKLQLVRETVQRLHEARAVSSTPLHRRSESPSRRG